MSTEYSNEPMLDMFIFETTQLTEQLEKTVLDSEKSNSYTSAAINEIFRIMHTIKGSSAMMMFDNISSLTHSIEDMFYFIREQMPSKVDYSALSDLVFQSIDFIKVEIEKIKNGDSADGDALALIDNIEIFLSILKQDNVSTDSQVPAKQEEFEKQQFYISSEKVKNSNSKNAFKAIIRFKEGSDMENIRAYSIVHSLKELSDQLFYIPANIIDDEKSADIIREEGFKIFIKSNCSCEEIREVLLQTVFLSSLDLVQLESEAELEEFPKDRLHVLQQPNKTIQIQKQDSENIKEETRDNQLNSLQQNLISVNVNKLDKLMDLVGEMVIAESMVTQNPDLNGLELNNFDKAARQLRKITSELQDVVMSVRMLPVSATFQKMHRIVRDMCKKLNKEVHLELIGEETEVDKNIIEHISDPLMHLIRNSIDHGIENAEERLEKGKPQSGRITLKAQNAGNDVIITIRDDGKGLNREKILAKAREHGLINKQDSEIPDKEIYSMIFMPGFSTKDSVTEFSGRGVGMDVVVQNIETVGGSVSVDSTPNLGTTITLKIPLTLAIVDGMNIRIGEAVYTIPTISIKESFKANEKNLIKDPDGNEMIMVRGQCYPMLRLRDCFKIRGGVTEITEGITIMVESENKVLCLLADELIGQQQVVVKTLPAYIKNIRKIKGLSGCTLLGDGSISLILDVSTLISINQ